MTCRARQHSDQMLCECGLAWDVNDPDPPDCRAKVWPAPVSTAIDKFFVESKLAGVTVRRVKMSCDELTRLRRERDNNPLVPLWAGYYRGVPVQLVKENVWLK